MRSVKRSAPRVVIPAASPLHLTSQLYRRRAERQQSQGEWSSVPRRRAHGSIIYNADRLAGAPTHNTNRLHHILKFSRETPRSNTEAQPVAEAADNQKSSSWASHYVDSIELANKCRRFYTSRQKFVADMKRLESLETAVTHHGDARSRAQDTAPSLSPRERAFDDNVKTLRAEMLSLIDLDLELFCVFLELNEKLEDVKWNRRLLEGTSDAGSCGSLFSDASFATSSSDSAVTSRHNSDDDDVPDDVVDDVIYDNAFEHSLPLLLQGKPLLKAPSPQPPAVDTRVKVDRPIATPSTRSGTHLGVSGRMYSIRHTADAHQKTGSGIAMGATRQGAASNMKPNRDVVRQHSGDSEFNSIYRKIKSSIV